MLDTIKYENEIREITRYAQEEKCVSEETINKTFKILDDDLFNDIEDYLDSIGIDIIRTIKDDDEPSDEELVKEFNQIKNIKENISSTEKQNINNFISSYFTEIGQIPLLTFEEEVELGKRIKAGYEAETRLANNLNIGDDEKEKLRKISSDGLMARECLIESNLKLVVSIAKHYQNRGLSLMDLIQEGNLGLIKAVYRFDPSKGFRFSTYGTWWIRQAITRAIVEQGRMVRIPAHVIDSLNKLKKARRELSMQLGYDPSIKEIADKLNLKESDIEYLDYISQDIVSLDSPISDDDDTLFSDMIEDTTASTTLEFAIREENKERIADALSTLPPREARIINLRYGFVDNIPKTLDEIGREFGITRERVRQLEIRAIRHLRHPSRMKILRKVAIGKTLK